MPALLRLTTEGVAWQTSYLHHTHTSPVSYELFTKYYFFVSQLFTLELITASRPNPVSELPLAAHVPQALKPGGLVVKTGRNEEHIGTASFTEEKLRLGTLVPKSRNLVSHPFT
jgi:hypothetical protein